jgi:azurin
MRYDTPRLVVEAGKPFEIRFENVDFMPHNLVVVRPGTREKIGLVSGKMKPDELDDEDRAFVPKSPDILGATKLIEPHQKTALKMTAPTEEGEYEYFCTYPGHYLIMWGQLIVTRDVDSYVKSHPQPILPTSTAKSDSKGYE